jgi:hypothetical protein
VSARQSLEKFALPHLEGLLAFTVVTEESDPHEACPLDVTIDPNGITLRWVGERKPQWQGTWTELRSLIESWAIVDKERKAAEDEHSAAMELYCDAERELAKAKGDAVILPMKKPATSEPAATTRVGEGAE